MSTKPRCIHNRWRTVMIEIDHLGNVEQRTYCGDLSRLVGCLQVIADDRGVGNADVGQEIIVNVGKAQFSIKVQEET